MALSSLEFLFSVLCVSKEGEAVLIFHTGFSIAATHTLPVCHSSRFTRLQWTGSWEYGHCASKLDMLSCVWMRGQFDQSSLLLLLLVLVLRVPIGSYLIAFSRHCPVRSRNDNVYWTWRGIWIAERKVTPRTTAWHPRDSNSIQFSPATLL